MRVLPILTATVLFAAAASCGNHIPGVPVPVDDTPSVTIVSPHDGDTIESSSTWLTLEAHNAVLGTGGAASVVEHVYLDGNAIGETGKGKFLVSRMQPGTHELGARLFDADGSPIPGAKASTIHITVPPGSPRLVIASPGDGAIVDSSSVELTLSWSNYASNDWDATVDSPEAPVAANAEDPTWVVSRVDAGEHEVYVRLLWGPNDPVDPPVEDRVRVFIPSTAPAITIGAPLMNATVPRSGALHVDTRNFVVDGNKAGGANEPGVGHYHVYLDGYDSSHMWQEGYADDITLDNLAVGEHDLYVRLMNNDHTSIDPKVVDWIHLTVTP